MRIIFAGTPDVAIPTLDSLVASGFDVVAILTRPDAPIGRKRVLTPSPVAQRAAELGIDIIRATRIDDSAVARISSSHPDLGIIVAYGAIIPPSALTIPTQGWINLHFSLLPAWRGAAPVQHAILHGDDLSGASIFQLETGLDTGPIFSTVTETVRPNDTSGDLLHRLSHSGATLMTQTVAAIASGAAQAKPQQGEPSLAPKLTIDDGRIDWSQPALAIHRRSRALTPEPGAWTTLAGQRFKLAPVTLHPDRRDLKPGHMSFSSEGVFVGTGSHAVQLDQVQPAGKKLMSAQEWVRGVANRESTAREEIVFV